MSQKKPEPGDDADFLNDLSQIPNDEFSQFQKQPAPTPKPDPEDDPDDHGDDFFDPFFMDDGDEDMDGFAIPLFTLGKIDEGEFTDEELDALARVRPMLACPECNDPTVVCESTFAHLAECAMWRMATLGAEIHEIVAGLRYKLGMMGADTSGSLDLTILSIAGEITRLKTLIPKLLRTQAVIDDF